MVLSYRFPNDYNSEKKEGLPRELTGWSSAHEVCFSSVDTMCYGNGQPAKSFAGKFCMMY